MITIKYEDKTICEEGKHKYKVAEKLPKTKRMVLVCDKCGNVVNRDMLTS